MKTFAYSTAGDLDDAVAHLAQNGSGSGMIRPLAGGTDLLTLIKADIVAPDELIDIKRADGLHSRVDVTDHEITLGTLVSLAQIEFHQGLKDRCPALVEAARLAATPQLRNMATIGGNLLQRPRCWYYRGSQFQCWLKGGDECQAREGENQFHALFGTSPCVAVHPSDAASALLAYDASVVLRGPDGTRAVRLAKFFAEPDESRRTENTMRADEILTEIRFPVPSDGTRSTYLKAMDRKVWAFALVGVAIAARVDGGIVTESRIVLAGVAPIPWRSTEAESIVNGRRADESLFVEAADAALADVRPLARNAYKVPLAKSLIRRALTEVTA